MMLTRYSGNGRLPQPEPPRGVPAWTYLVGAFLVVGLVGVVASILLYGAALVLSLAYTHGCVAMCGGA